MSIKPFFAILQYLIPQHLLSNLAGKLANCKAPLIKNTFIRLFMRFYPIDLSEALVQHPADFKTFNDFFTRKLKSDARPLGKGIVSPVDGTLAERGQIAGNRLLQAKGLYFSLETLLGSPQDTQAFVNGQFLTLYLAPHNYHRVHMPMDGTLTHWRFIPGRLFSVNRLTTDLIPNLYGRNERLVCFFESDAGPFVLILVGALIVGGIQPSWMERAIQSNQVIHHLLDQPLTFKKGQELGLFRLGSTVIELFPANTLTFADNWKSGTPVKMGRSFGNFVQSNDRLSLP